MSPPLDRRLVITALGVAQILAWGTSFYFPAVFAGPIVTETGWSLGYVVGGTSLGLLVAGLISPQVGRIIDKHGGRPVLLASSLCYAAGLAGIGLAPALPVYLAAWVVLGLGMGTGLYDAVFAALGRMYGSAARAADHQSHFVRRLRQHDLLAAERFHDRTCRLAQRLLHLRRLASLRIAAACRWRWCAGRPPRHRTTRRANSPPRDRTGAHPQ